MKTLQEAIEQIKRLDAARNGEVACDDLDTLLIPFLDALPDLIALLEVKEDRDRRLVKAAIATVYPEDATDEEADLIIQGVDAP